MRIFIILLNLVLFVAGGCRSSKEQSLVLTGSSTVAPLAAEIGKRFEKHRAGVRIDVQTGGSSRGIADARDGSADIGMASRALKDSEHDLTAHVIARDGIAVIAHRDNRLDELTSDQVRAVYTGATSDWSALGGEAGPITVVTKASGRATLEVFSKHFGLAEADIKAQVVIGDNQEAIKTVTGNPRAIAYVSIGTAEYEASAGAPIKLLRLDGKTPSTATVADGSYPVYRPLLLITAGQPKKLASEFITFARSKDMHDLVRAQHFVPVSQ
jgi:phosphate transport system substrate-binding protein